MKQKSFFFIALIFSLNVQAFNFPWNDQVEEVYNSVIKNLSAKGNIENKTITYHIKDISKREIDKSYVPRDESLPSATIAYLQDTFGRLKAEAQIYSNIYLGFDNKNFYKNNISIEGKNIQITLPKIEIISTDIDFENTILITKKSGILTTSKERDELVNNLYNDHKKEMIDHIMKGEENLTEATINAKTIIKDIIVRNFGADYKITFVE